MRHYARNRKEPRAHRECEKGLCKVCNWNLARTPHAWLDQGPGTPYPCTSRVLGRSVVMKRDDPKNPSKIVACATPIGANIHRSGKRAHRQRCQSSFMVQSPLGITTPVPRSVVQGRLRWAKSEPCLDYSPQAVDPAYIESIVRENTRAGRHPGNDIDDLPFPHRAGSSACCLQSKRNYRNLLDQLNTYRKTSRKEDRDGLRDQLLKDVRLALPRYLRARVPVETDEQIVAAIGYLRDHCFNIWMNKIASMKEGVSKTKRAFRRRIASLPTEMQTIAYTPEMKRTTRFRSVAGGGSVDVAALLGRMEYAYASQFLAQPVESQRRRIKTVFKKFRRTPGFDVDALSGEELLETAAQHFFSR